MPTIFASFYTFHMLYLDGVYTDDGRGGYRFVAVTQHHKADIVNLTHKISLRLERFIPATHPSRDRQGASQHAGMTARA